MHTNRDIRIHICHLGNLSQHLTGYIAATKVLPISFQLDLRKNKVSKFTTTLIMVDVLRFTTLGVSKLLTSAKVEIYHILVIYL